MMSAGEEQQCAVRELAGAAGLHLDEERVAALTPKLSSFRAFLQQAREIPLSDSEPAHLAPVEGWDDA